VFDGEALAGPGVKDARFREEVGRQLLNPFPRESVLLTHRDGKGFNLKLDSIPRSPDANLVIRAIEPRPAGPAAA
jgi:hypothetical protein